MKKSDSKLSKTEVASFSQSDVIDLLKKFAKSEYEIVRLKAIQVLRKINAINCISIYLDALKDSDEDVRIDVTEVLGQIGDQTAIEHLLESLTYDPCAEVKLACVNSLTLLKANVAIPMFRSLVLNKNPEITWDSEEAYQDDWDNWLDIQIAVIKALGQMRDERAIELIAKAINDPEGQDLDSVAFDALGAIGEKSLPTLAEFAKSPLRRRKYYALRAISKLDSPTAYNLLETALNDEDDSIRVLALQALLRDEPNSKFIERGLTDKSDEVRQIAYSYTDVNQGDIIEHILNDPSTKVQIAFIKRLDLSNEIIDKNDVKFKILKLLADSDSVEVSAVAFAKLSAFAPKLVKKQIDNLISNGATDSDNTERYLWAIISEIKQSNQPLCLQWILELCESPIASVRLKALAELGIMRRNPEMDLKFQKKSMDLIAKLARRKISDEIEIIDQKKIADNNVNELRSIGLKVDDNVNSDSGPTSSLSAILNQNQVVNQKSLNTEQEPSNEQFELDEQSDQAGAGPHFEFNSMQPNTFENSTEFETCKLAIQLLGENQDSQELLLEIIEEGRLEIAECALSALYENVKNFGISLSIDRISQILQYYIALGKRDILIQVLKIIPHLNKVDENLKDFLRVSLSNNDPLVRGSSLKTNCIIDHNSITLQPYLQDPSPLVRQQCMNLMLNYTPDSAHECIIDFLLENPDQSIDTCLKDEKLNHEIIGAQVAGYLSNQQFKAKIPILLDMLGSLYQQEIENDEFSV